MELLLLSRTQCSEPGLGHGHAVGAASPVSGASSAILPAHSSAPAKPPLRWMSLLPDVVRCSRLYVQTSSAAYCVALPWLQPWSDYLIADDDSDPPPTPQHTMHSVQLLPAAREQLSVGDNRGPAPITMNVVGVVVVYDPGAPHMPHTPHLPMAGAPHMPQFPNMAGAPHMPQLPNMADTLHITSQYGRYASHNIPIWQIRFT